MGNPPIKITRTLLTFKSMTLKLHVKLKGDNDKFSFKYHIESEYLYQKYLTLNPSVFLSIDVIDKENNYGFDKSKSLIITQKTVFRVIMFFRRLVKSMYTKDLFITKGNEIILQRDVAENVKELLQVSQNNAIVGIPAVIYDENEISYEGVHLFINKTSNLIPLTFTELETLLYMLEKVDLFQYSQLLLNYYVSYYRDELRKDNQSVCSNRGNDKFIWEDRQSTVTANFSKEKEDIMSGLPT